MIDFEPNSEQEMLVNSISRFAKGPMRKVFRVSEEEGRVPADIVQLLIGPYKCLGVMATFEDILWNSGCVTQGVFHH